MISEMTGRGFEGGGFYQFKGFKGDKLNMVV